MIWSSKFPQKLNAVSRKEMQYKLKGILEMPSAIWYHFDRKSKIYLVFTPINNIIK